MKKQDIQTKVKKHDLTDGRAFQLMRANNMPLALIANLANTTESEVLRLLELAKESPPRPSE